MLFASSRINPHDPFVLSILVPPPLLFDIIIRVVLITVNNNAENRPIPKAP